MEALCDRPPYQAAFFHSPFPGNTFHYYLVVFWLSLNIWRIGCAFVSGDDFIFTVLLVIVFDSKIVTPLRRIFNSYRFRSSTLFRVPYRGDCICLVSLYFVPLGFKRLLLSLARAALCGAMSGTP